MRPISVNREFIEGVLEVINANREKARELRRNMYLRYEEAYDVLKRALNEWIDRASIRDLIDAFGCELLDKWRENEELGIRDCAKLALADMLTEEQVELAKAIAMKDEKVRKTLKEYERLHKRAEEEEARLKPIIDTLMPVEKYQVITIENMVKLMIVVYKICRELEKMGIEP